jgi:hypothetical protein
MILARKVADEMYLGIFVVATFVLIWILAIFGIMFGARYKSEEKRKRIFNRVGLWRNIFHILITAGLLLYVIFIYRET